MMARRRANILLTGANSRYKLYRLGRYVFSNKAHQDSRPLKTSAGIFIPCCEEKMVFCHIFIERL
ncbi:MAG: hypothetical protein QHH14_01650 [Clostridiales bacterium]|nr:hypothetical protein [Clostridiales bacterium]